MNAPVRKLTVICLFTMLLTLCNSCESLKQPALDTGQKPSIEKTTQKPSTEKTTKAPPAVPDVPPDVVAKIGDYVIKGQELEKKIISEIRTEPMSYDTPLEHVDAKTTLLNMIAEKAMIMDARERNLLNDEVTRSFIKSHRQKNLAKLLLSSSLKDRVTVTDDEIEQLLKKNPKLNRKRAETMLKRAKGKKLVGEYYNQIYNKVNVRKLPENFSKAAELYRKLLRQSAQKERMVFVRSKQVREDLTEEEKNIALAVFDGGSLTVKDWFDAICDYSPPSRPKDLTTPKGVEKMLDNALRTPLFVLEAEAKGLDKNESFLERVNRYEEAILIGKALKEVAKNIKEPTDENLIIEYFKKNADRFKTLDRMKTDQIWCDDLQTARQAKADIESGLDFEEARQKYSLYKQAKPRHSNIESENIFFEQIWQAEPNDIIGPVKGLVGNKVKFRIIKILEKKPGQQKEYSENMKRTVAFRMQEEQRRAALAEYKDKLLKKYPYKIYTERIKEFDPLKR